MTNFSGKSAKARRAEPPENWRAFPILKPSEVEAVIGCSHAHLYKLIKLGHLRSIKIGSSTHIPTEQVIELITNGAPVTKNAEKLVRVAS